MSLPDDEAQTETEEQVPAPTETQGETPPEEEQAESKDSTEEAGEESEGEEKKETEAEEAKGEEGKDGESEPEPEEKRRRAGGWQRKIERLERQNELLVQQLSIQRPPGTPQPPAPPAKEPTAEEKAEAYIDGVVERRLAAKEQQRQTQAAQTEFQRRTAEVRAKRPDYDEAIESVRHIPVHNEVNAALLTSEHGAEIMYQLATNPAELARLSALPPLVAVMEIGRLAAKLATAAPSSPKPKSALRPPVPPTSVKGSTSNTRNLDDLPLPEYKRAYRSGRR